MRCLTVRLLRLFVPSALLLAAPLPCQGAPADFAETFALATDRAKVLEQLVPGTVDYYYYHCLQAQHTGAFAEVPKLLAAWIERHGRSARVEEVENRQALLTFGQDPQATYAFLRQRLGLRFDAERQARGERADLPTQFDQALLSPAALTAKAFAAHPNSLDGFTDAALPALAAAGVPDPLLRPFLQRLARPDLPNLPALVARELRLPKSPGFGSLPVHSLLLQAQLDELLQLEPSLIDQPRFVGVYLQRLLPGADERLRDPATRGEYLQRLWRFAERLSPAHNALKAHVLYHYLQHDLAAGTLDKQRFLAYLRLPRRTGYANPELLRKSRGSEIVSGGEDFPTGLRPIGDDEALVRACFEQIFVREDGYAPYAEFVREDWLRRLFAEIKLLAGVGDMERWYSLLDDPAYYERLVARVEIAFPPAQPRHFGMDEPVVVEADVKNVPKLLVKVFRIDAYAYAKDTGREVDASIDLDGVVANAEDVHAFTEPPLRRVRRRFEFPALKGAGTYVVELVGNGVSSRAVIQKGRLVALERLGAAGPALTVLDERGEVVRDATVFCAGHEYAAGEDGSVQLPFAPAETKRMLVLHHGDLATLQPFVHRAEEYRLDAGVFVAREALRAGQQAQILVRPRLYAQGQPIALDLLEDAAVEVTARGRDGVASLQTLRAPQWADGLLVHTIQVPDDLAELTVVLRGRVENLSQQQRVDVSSPAKTFPVNAIDATPAIACPLLGRDADGWFLEVRGKDGEPLAGRAVHLQLRHRDYTDPIAAVLAAGSDGRIALGALDGIVSVRADGLPDDNATWTLPGARASLPDRLAGVAGETLRVAYTGRAQKLDRSVATLLELRGGVPYRDASAALALAQGCIELRELPAGDYELWLADAGRRIAVQVTAGKVFQRWAIGAHRALPLVSRAPLQIAGLSADDTTVTIELAHAGAEARVHVFASRYLPAFDPWAHLWIEGAPAAAAAELPRSESTYAAGRELGDELRYVLERRYATRFPGNMLHRPSLLLNPWSPVETPVAFGEGGAGGGKYGARRGGPAGAPRPTVAAAGGEGRIGPGAYADLDFLPGATPLLTGLRADAEGRVRVRRADLGDGRFVHVLATDGDDTVQRSLALASAPLAPRDRTLQKSLDPQQHFAEQRRLQFVTGGGEAVIEDASTAKLQTYATLADVHRLLLSLRKDDADLAEFAFLVRWPDLGDDEKRQLYRQHACHELHFFLYRHDRAFFDAVLRPYLANKAHKTFLDHYLLDDDLSAYLDPRAFARLNLVERILLLQRLPGQADALHRYVQDRGELRPADPAAVWFGLEAALRSGDLDLGREQAGKKILAAAEELRAHRADEKGAEAEKAGAVPVPAPQAPAAGGRLADKDAGEPAEDARRKAEAKEVRDDAERLENLEQEQQAADRGARARVRGLYRAPEPTRRYVESDYWHRLPAQEDPELIPANGFWRDFAQAPAGQPFGSVHVAEAAGSFTEAMLALAVLDLPFQAKPAATSREGNRLVVRPATPVLLARSEVLPAAGAAAPDAVLVRQNIVRLDDPYVFVGDERRAKYVTGEFLVGVPYSCQVVLTNPSETPRRLSLLLQVPRGAMPLQQGFYTRSVPVALGAFATTSVDYAFYFPAPGDFEHFPAQVAQDGAFVAAAASAPLHVVATPSAVDTTSWEHVSQDGTPEAVLAYLQQHNVARLDLARIAWRVRDKGFFGAVVDLLRQRFVYDDTIWSHALLHGDERAAREYLLHADRFLAACGPALQSPLVVIDPVERRAYEHVEFEPLFPSRAHRIGPWRRTSNQDLARQWAALVRVLECRPRLDGADWASVTYYLLLQGRIEEAQAAFARIDAAALPMHLQYDYLSAYLSFFGSEPERARRVAERYRDYPVERWRLLYRDVLQQLDEAQGQAVAAADQRDRTQQQTALAASEPALDVAVAGDTVTIRHQNVASCEVRYHKLDVEFAFSTSPFAQQGIGAVGWVQPSRVDVVTLAPDRTETSFQLPAEFQRSNLVVEVRGAGLVKRATSLASALAVQTVEGYGQLTVRDAKTSAPLPKVYVKVYARLPGGAVRFHKDGYTDLRGRFDYASVSERGTEGAERYAILMLSEDRGAVIREVTPPGR